MDLQVNELPIVPVDIWRPTGTVSPNIIRIDNFQNYCFDGGTGQVHWVLFVAEDIPAVDAVEATENAPAIPAKDAYTKKTPIMDGYVTVPSETLQQWGADDSIIFNYVLDELNIGGIN